MKIGGVTPTPLNALLVLPRDNGPDIVFHAQPVENEKFHELCPAPKASVRKMADGSKERVENDAYKVQVSKWLERKYDYTVLYSLIPSDIEWDEVDLGVPSTWSKWRDEFKNGGLCAAEVERVLALVAQANSLDESKLKEAREAFLAGQGKEAEKSSGPYRTAEYAIWRSCLRVGIKPPGLKNAECWEDLSVTMQAKVLAFDQTMSYDEIPSSPEKGLRRPKPAQSPRPVRKGKRGRRR